MTRRPRAGRREVGRRRCRADLPVFGFGGLLLALLLFPGDAVQAQLGARAYDDWPVRAVRLEGVPEKLVAEVLGGLALTQKSGLLGRRPARFSTRLLRHDRDRVRLFLARRGYPTVEVAFRLEPDLAAEKITVVFTVAAGSIVAIGEVEVVGLPEAAREGTDLALQELRSTELFRDSVVQAAVADIEQELMQAGYAFPEVRAEIIRRSETLVDVILRIEPGDPHIITSIRITGAPPDLEPLARRTVDIVPGTPYSPGVIEDARHSLRTLLIFQRIRLTVSPTAPGELELLVELTPRRYNTLSAAVGTWSDFPIRVRASWIHRNLFKKGRGFLLAGAFASADREARATFWWDALLRIRSRASFTLAYEVDDEDAYLSETEEAVLSNLFHTLGTVSWRVGIRISDTELERRTDDEIAFQQDDGKALTFDARWFRDATDSPLDPSRGTRTTLLGAYAPPILFTDAPYVALNTTLTGYRSFLYRGAVVAGRVDVGVAWPLGEAVDLLANKRFYAGGFNTMRGYRRRELGPTDSQGNPIGGEARILATLDLRLPIKGILGASLFIDTGQVWSQVAEIDMSDYAVAGGGGLMVHTPVGPVRLEVAYNITTPQPGRDRVILQFGIGHPF